MRDWLLHVLGIKRRMSCAELQLVRDGWKSLAERDGDRLEKEIRDHLRTKELLTVAGNSLVTMETALRKAEAVAQSKSAGSDVARLDTALALSSWARAFGDRLTFIGNGIVKHQNAVDRMGRRVARKRKN